MWTNKTGAPVCIDNQNNVVPCDSPEAAFRIAGEGQQLSAEQAGQYKGLPEGEDNAPTEDTDPGDEQPAEAPTTAKATGKDTKKK